MTGLEIMIYGLIILLITQIGYLIYTWLRFPNKILVLNAGNDQNLVTISRAREFKEDGVNKWHIQKLKINVTVPKKKSIFLLNKFFGVGFVAIGRWDPLSSTFTWFDYKQDEGIMQDFEAGDIAFFHAEEKKRAKYGKGFLSSPEFFGMINVSILALVIILGMVFFQDIAGAVVETNNRLAQPLIEYQQSMNAHEERMIRLEQRVTTLEPEELTEAPN